MSKVINLPNIISEIDFFTPAEHFETHRSNFLKSHLGQCYSQLPWDKLCRHFRPIKSRCGRGRKSIFTTQSKVALMFLKAYTNLSDSDLYEQLQSNIFYQFFCNIYISPFVNFEPGGFKIISAIRVELSRRGDWHQFQQILARHWKPRMDQLNVMLCDATCYETSIRHPTDVKLLWECCEWLYRQLTKSCKLNGLVKPRSKYAEQKCKYLSYQKSRKKTNQQTIARQRSLLHLLSKLIDQMESVLSMNNLQYVVNEQFKKRYKIIKKILIQQRDLFEGKPVKNRIVSIDKSYIRPIVRGKETKRVEFGAKVNMIQVDNLNFIETLSFEAFNEGTKLKTSVELTERLFGTCTHIAADAIYATNENRKFCSGKSITHSFVRKGRAGKNEEQRKIITRELSRHRSSRMEGGFGNEKNNYGLHKIRARSDLTEILWLYFGVHIANASKMAKRA